MRQCFLLLLERGTRGVHGPPPITLPILGITPCIKIHRLGYRVSSKECGETWLWWPYPINCAYRALPGPGPCGVYKLLLDGVIWDRITERVQLHVRLTIEVYGRKKNGLQNHNLWGHYHDYPFRDKFVIRVSLITRTNLMGLVLGKSSFVLEIVGSCRLSTEPSPWPLLKPHQVKFGRPYTKMALDQGWGSESILDPSPARSRVALSVDAKRNKGSDGSVRPAYPGLVSDIGSTHPHVDVGVWRGNRTNSKERAQVTNGCWLAGLLYVLSGARTSVEMTFLLKAVETMKKGNGYDHGQGVIALLLREKERRVRFGTGKKKKTTRTKSMRSLNHK